jgi:hypothetical protein
MPEQMSLLAAERCPRERTFAGWVWPCARRTGHPGPCVAEFGSHARPEEAPDA